MKPARVRRRRTVAEMQTLLWGYQRGRRRRSNFAPPTDCRIPCSTPAAEAGGATRAASGRVVCGVARPRLCRTAASWAYPAAAIGSSLIGLPG